MSQYVRGPFFRNWYWRIMRWFGVRPKNLWDDPETRRQWGENLDRAYEKAKADAENALKDAR